jgi:hypothetical protein
MAEGATPAKGVPAGLPVGWIAPESAIMDVWDLAEMRDALREGKTVTVASNGHVYVSHDAAAPMTPQTETFIESKLGEIKKFLLTDGGMTIEPNGKIRGDFAGHRMKYNLDPDPNIGTDDLNLIHSAIAAGANVGILPDGSVHYMLTAGAKAPDAATAKQIMDGFDAEIRSGAVAKALAEGRAVRLIGDTVDEVPAPTLAEGFPFPEPGQEEPPPEAAPVPAETVDVETMTDPAAMQKLSADLTERSATLRRDIAERLETETVRLGTERDTHARREWGAQQEAAAAKQQVLRETRLKGEERVTIDRLETRARALEAKGDAAGAVELREEARVHLGREAAAGDRARAADAERVALETRAADHARHVKTLESQIAQVDAQVQAAEPALDAMEQRAKLLASAGTQLAEADRLDQEAARARADGDTVAATDIQRAADFARQQGRHDLAEADAAPVDPDVLGAAAGAQRATTDAAPRSVTLPPTSEIEPDIVGDSRTAVAASTESEPSEVDSAAVATVDAAFDEELEVSLERDVADIDDSAAALAVATPEFDSGANAEFDVMTDQIDNGVDEVEPDSFGDLA